VSRKLNITVERHDDHVVVRVGGEVDLAVADQFQTAVTEELDLPPHRVVVVLRDVDFMDSTGLRALLLTSQRAASHGERLRLAELSQPVLRLLEIADLGDAIPAFGTVEEACADIQARGDDLLETEGGSPV
jgi:anti-anti-sigma factor